MKESGRTRGWVLARVAGTEVILSPGWAVTAVVLTVLLLPFARRVTSGAVGEWLLAAAAVLLLMASTLAHELAHAGVARRVGMPVRQIVLTFLGGHTELGGRAPSPRASALVAVAGPVTNLALAGVAWLGYQLTSPGPVRALVLATAVANVFVGALNLLPGLPLDGGFVLESWVWSATGRRATGTRVAGWAGRAVAVVLGGWMLWQAVRDGSLTTALWGALVAGFIWTGASQALSGVATEQAVGALSVRALMRPAVPVDAAATVAGLAPVPPGSAVVVVDPSGRALGLVDPTALAAVPAAVRGSTPVTAVSTPLPPEASVPVDATGHAALDAVRRGGQRSATLVVTDAAGSVTGVLAVADVARALRA